MAEVEQDAAELRSEGQPLGEPGRPMDRRSPFVVGMVGAAGVAVTVGLVAMISATRDVLILIGLAMFIAIGLEPAVAYLVKRGLARGWAVAAVCLGLLAAVAGFLAVAIPALVQQASAFVDRAPQLLESAQDQSSWLGQLNQRFGLQDRIEQLLSADGGALVSGLLGAGAVVLGALVSTLLVLVLVIYFLADMPRIRRGLYRLVPHSRRPRAMLLGDEIFAKIGGFVLGNVVIATIAGTTSFIWLTIFQVPYPLLVSILVALLNIVPTVGPLISIVLASLLALTVSVPVALATAGFFLGYRLIENYFLLPKIMGRAVEVPALVTVVAVTVGAVLLGAVGAIVAIPVAAAIGVVGKELLIPRLDRS